jgi:hypothetical protein
MITCTVVNVESDMPSIMMRGPFQTGLRYYDEAEEISTEADQPLGWSRPSSLHSGAGIEWASALAVPRRLKPPP